MPFILSVNFNDRDRQFTNANVAFTYDEILKIIGPSMFGYIQRRHGKGVSGNYSFEPSVIEAARAKIADQVGSRQLNLLQYEIDILMLHFKQMGTLRFEEVEDAEGETFRGLTLTEHGERYLKTISLT